jgi:hypothetical protein
VDSALLRLATANGAVSTDHRRRRVGALIVSDIKVAHEEVAGQDIGASEMWHGAPFPPEARLPGPDPKRESHGSFFAFADPTATPGSFRR